MGNTDAYQIYCLGYTTSLGENKFGAIQYYGLLRDAIISEYKQQGFCELIDNIIETRKENDRIDIVNYSIFQDVINVFGGSKPADTSTCIPYIPSVANRSFLPQTSWMSWTELPYIKQNGQDVYFYRDISCLIANLRKMGRQAHMINLEEQRKKKECSIVDEKAHYIIEQAQLKAKKIVDDAQNEAKIYKIKKSGIHVSSDLESKNTIADDLIRKYLTEDRLEYRRALEKEIETIIRESQDGWKGFEKTHNELCDRTNSLQASWIGSITSLTDQLGTIKEEFYKTLHDWQVALYPHELRPLAERYIELYRIINVDRLLTDEIISKYKKIIGKEQKKNNSGLIEITDGSGNEYTGDKLLPSTIESISKLNKTLTTFLHKFELSLNGLDMYVFFPEVGQKFDEIWHILENDDDYEKINDSIIERCIVPGVAKKVSGESEDDVIIPAIVEI